VLIPAKFKEKEAGLERNLELLDFSYWLRVAAMDEHVVPGFRRLILRLFDLQHISQALTQRRSLKKLIVFVQGRSSPKDSGLQPEKGFTEEVCTCAPNLLILALAAERVQQCDHSAGAEEKLLYPQESRLRECQRPAWASQQAQRSHQVSDNVGFVGQTQL